MPPKSLRRSLPVFLLLCGLLVAGCPDGGDDSPPVPPTYTPADVDALIASDGGTGGGPNMGTFNVVLFDDEGATPVRIQGAEVLVWHGGGGTPEQAQTDATGEAVFAGITPGAITFTALKTGYVNMTVVDLNAATAVLSMDPTFFKVTGQIQGYTIGNTIEVGLETMVRDEMDKVYSMKYGQVLSVIENNPGQTDYELLFQAGVTDTLIVKEIDANGRIVARDTRVIGPYTGTPPTVDFTLTAGTTDLHEIDLTVSQCNPAAAAVVGRYLDPVSLYTYWSYGTSASGGNVWTFLLQMPKNMASADVVIETYGLGGTPGADLPLESFRRTVSTGAPDLAPTPNSVTLSLWTLSGDILNPQDYPDFFLIEIRYDDRSHMTIGMQLPGSDFSLRVPNNAPVTFRVIEIHDAGASGGAMVGHLQQTGSFTGDDNAFHFDLASASTSLIDITTNIPGGITTPSGMGLLTGPHSNGEFLAVPFMAPGTESGGQIQIPLRWGSLGTFTFLFGVIVQEDGVPEDRAARSIYLQGHVTNPATDPGSAPTLALLDAPQIMAPVPAGTVNRASLQFAWLGDPAATTEGIYGVDIRDQDSIPRWRILVRGATNQFTLPPLPAGVLRTTYDIPAADYTVKVNCTRVANLDFDDFTMDIMPSEIDMFVNENRIWRMSEGVPVDFTLN